MRKKNCPLKHTSDGKIEGRIEVKGRRGGRPEQLLDSLKERRKTLKFKDEALYCNVRRIVLWTERERERERENLVMVKMTTGVVNPLQDIISVT